MLSRVETKPTPGCVGDASAGCFEDFICALALLQDDAGRSVASKYRVADLMGVSATTVLRCVRICFERGYVEELVRGCGGRHGEKRAEGKSIFRLTRDCDDILRELEAERKKKRGGGKQ